jgi:hypothetical protein
MAHKPAIVDPLIYGVATHPAIHINNLIKIRSLIAPSFLICRYTRGKGSDDLY